MNMDEPSGPDWGRLCRLALDVSLRETEGQTEKQMLTTNCRDIGGWGDVKGAPAGQRSASGQKKKKNLELCECCHRQLLCMCIKMLMRTYPVPTVSVAGGGGGRKIVL